MLPLECIPEDTGAVPLGISTAGSCTVLTEEEPTVLRLTAQHQQAEQVTVFWKLIEGMLTNLGGLPLDHIQKMLKFAPGHDHTVDRLGGFMDAARREGLVSVKDGIWHLNR